MRVHQKFPSAFHVCTDLHSVDKLPVSLWSSGPSGRRGEIQRHICHRQDFKSRSMGFKSIAELRDVNKAPQKVDDLILKFESYLRWKSAAAEASPLLPHSAVSHLLLLLPPPLLRALLTALHLQSLSD